MRVLDKPLRNKLESAIKAARDIAEEGSRIALQALAVDASDPFAHLTPEDRDLRNRLRARARQIGDQKVAGNGKHGISHLVQECAYEHWHRMLFARFLAENGLLMHPEGVAVTLKECEELAPEEGAENGWELAARYASKMLPQIFRPDAPVLQVKLPPEHQKKLEKLLDDLSVDTFKARDSLGWVYQFWQAKRKDEINASEVKIGADELPAVTQLFTEPYMVDFLLQNTLGAWWVGRHGKDSLPVEMPYLRFLDDGKPAAGTFDGWPDRAAEITVLDPCCGSGHFLVAAFDILVRYRMVEEGLSADEAGDAVLRDNIHGLEIDERCTQIAAFALAFAAWTFPGSSGYRPLPSMKIACSGLSLSVERSEWVQLIGDDPWLQNGMDQLYDLFEKAPVLGSLIDTEIIGLDRNKQGTLEAANIVSLLPKLRSALSGLKSLQDYQKQELSIIARGAIDALDILLEKFVLIVTNVPFLTEKRQTEYLRCYISKYFKHAKADLSTAMTAKLIPSLISKGTLAIVTPILWYFLISYREFRLIILKYSTMPLVVRIGPNCFESTKNETINIALTLITNCIPSNENEIAFIDVTNRSDVSSKKIGLQDDNIKVIQQLKMILNPDARIFVTTHDPHTLMSNFALCMRGIVCGDIEKWVKYYWELLINVSMWRYFQSAPAGTRMGKVTSCNRESIPFTGREKVIDWSTNGEGMLRPGKTNKAYGRKGVAIGQMGSLPITLYNGDLYDNSTAPLIPINETDLPALWDFCKSLDFFELVREIDQKMNVTNATFLKVPFWAEKCKVETIENYPNGLPKPYSDDPTQWIFHGHPCGSVIWDEEKKWTTIGPQRTDETVLQVAVARLLGYRWPAETDTEMDLSDESRHWVEQSEQLLPLADKDGIACIPPVRGEEPAHIRLLNLLTAAYGEQWSSSIRELLLKAVGCEGKDLDFWLRNKFFEQHCKLFHHRPFIWHIWDGLKDGFGVLVNYHKLDKKLLEALTYNYLGDWIKRQEDEQTRGVDGAGERLSAARVLKEKLELILHGEQPYDIFVRWKAINEQPIGWNPDLNDGVRLNIRPFMIAGILRKNPNINWGKDRGKDTQDSPWFHLFKGDRINDHHLPLGDKINARFQMREATDDSE